MMKRVVWIDMLRGFCMMCILYFHTEMYFAGKDITPYALYVGNVLSTFFFISGYLMKNNRPLILNYKMRMIVRRLLIPYLVFTTLFLLPKAIIHGQTHDLPVMALHIITGDASWFITALILSEIAFALLLHRLNGQTYSIITYGVLCLMASAAFGNSLSALYNKYNIWHINEALTGSFFISAGYLYHKYERQLEPKRKVLFYSVLCLLLIASKLFILQNDLKMVFGPTIVSCFPIFIADNLVFICLDIVLFKVLPLLKPVAWTGSHSLVYYFICGGVPLVVSRVFIAAGFSYTGYLSIIPVYLVVYLISSLIVKLVFCLKP